MYRDIAALKFTSLALVNNVGACTKSTKYADVSFHFADHKIKRIKRLGCR